MISKRYFTLRKIALYKFLGKFIPYFKNKIMNIIKKEDISESLRIMIEGILKTNNVIVCLERNNYNSISEYKSESSKNKGVSLLDSYFIEYKIREWDFSLVIDYKRNNVKFLLQNLPLTVDDYKIQELKTIFNNSENKKDITDYLDKIETIF